MSAPLTACEWDAGVAPASPSVPGCRLRMRALVAIGHSPVRIARALGEGVPVRTIRLILAGEPAALSASQLDRIRDLYEAWWDLCPPERTRGERVAAAAARRRAREAHWCTGMGLDDDLLDEPGYRPQCGWQRASGTGVATENPLRAVSPHT